MAAHDRGEQPFLDPTLIGDVLRQLELTAVDELEISDGQSRLYIRREPGERPPAREPASHSSVEPPVVGVPIMAPLTGVFYSRPSPEDPEYASVGSEVVIDQVVGLIETMKLFNEVKADVSGRVTEMSVRDGDLVEVGRPLMFVAPATEEGSP